MVTVVTGGCGYVGSWVVRWLSREQHVAILDVAKPGPLLAGLPNVTVIPCDVVSYDSVLGAMERARTLGPITGIIHLAAALAGQSFLAAPLDGVRLNVMGTAHILEAARVLGIGRLVIASSGAVYGDSAGPLTEETPAKVSDLYGATKIANELMALQYANHYGMDCRCVRLYFVYGPGLIPSKSHPLFRTMFGPLEGLTDLSLPAGSDQILDLTYALDMARGVSAALLTPETKHKIFNISGGKAYTISEVHRVIARYAPIPDNLRIGPGRLMPRGAPLDIRRAREELGYVPEYDLDRGVEALHRYLLRGELRESRP